MLKNKAETIDVYKVKNENANKVQNEMQSLPSFLTTFVYFFYSQVSVMHAPPLTGPPRENRSLYDFPD